MSKTENIRNFADVVGLYGGRAVIGNDGAVNLRFNTTHDYEDFRQHVGRALDISNGRGRLNEPDVSETLQQMRRNAYPGEVVQLTAEQHAELEREHMAFYRQTMADQKEGAARNIRNPIMRFREAVDRAAVRICNWLRLR